jgi:hypothetical protein
MRYNANFHPEWGYLAPAPSFVRRARVVLVAAGVGATVGVGVGFSWVSHPATETSVAARTLVRPVEAASESANTPAQVAQTNIPTTSESSASWTTQAPQGIAALADAPTATDAPAKAAIAAPPAAAKTHVVDPRPIKKKATKKPYVTSRYASRGEFFGLAPGEYYMNGSSDEYYASGARGGYYRDGGRWGGRRYQDW